MQVAVHLFEVEVATGLREVLYLQCVVVCFRVMLFKVQCQSESTKYEVRPDIIFAMNRLQ